jgi:hypothetical protein
MPLFTFRKGKKLRPAWSLQTTGPDILIWKLLISPSGILTGEERNVQEKTSSLFALDVTSGKTLWRGVTIDQPWWFASTYAGDTTLYLQTFLKPDLPEPRGIIALDIATGIERWRQPELSFLFESGEHVGAVRQGISARDHYLLSTITGEILEEFGEDTTELHARQSALVVESTYTQFADLLEPGDPDFETAASLLTSSLEIDDLRGPIEHLEHGSSMVLSYHARSRKSGGAMLRNLLSNEMLVLSRETGEVLFRETLHTETPLPLPDNFFVNRHTLIYVTEKRTVSGIRLP